MNDIMQLYILFILISFSGCTFFIGLPESNWTTSSHVCSLPGIEMINTDDVLNRSSNYMVFKEVEKAWTGTMIKHTRWAAFIGCGKSLSHMNSGISAKTADDCLRHCSDDNNASHFVLKDSSCYCLTHQPEVNGDINNCRTQCTNANYTPCSSGRSALVFTFVEGLNIYPTKKYIERECLTTTKSKTMFIVSDCNASNLYGCKNTSFVTIQKSWYVYQETCLKEKRSILYQKDTFPKDASAEIYYWTPIFRTHTVITGKLTKEDGESCIAVSTVGTNNNLTVENCTSKLPFLCSEKQRRNANDNSPSNTGPRFITLPLAVIIAVGIFIVLLVMIIIYLFLKLKKRREPFLNYSNEMKDGFPRASLSPNKVGLRDTYIDASDAPKRPGAGSYNDVYDDVHKGFIIKE